MELSTLKLLYLTINHPVAALQNKTSHVGHSSITVKKKKLLDRQRAYLHMVFDFNNFHGVEKVRKLSYYSSSKHFVPTTTKSCQTIAGNPYYTLLF